MNNMARNSLQQYNRTGYSNSFLVFLYVWAQLLTAQFKHRIKFFVNYKNLDKNIEIM